MVLVDAHAVEAELARDPDGYRSWFRTATSGSTGEPLTIVRTGADEAHLRARFMRVMFLNGLGLWDRVFVVRRARVSSSASRSRACS